MLCEVTITIEHSSNHPQQAAEFYRRGADQGDALAARKLAFLLEDNPAMSAEFGLVANWFQKGCDLGDVTSCHNVGVGYESDARLCYLGTAYPRITPFGSLREISHDAGGANLRRRRAQTIDFNILILINGNEHHAPQPGAQWISLLSDRCR